MCLSTVSPAICGSWTGTALSDPSLDGDNLWHSHLSGLHILNQALPNDLVRFAPDDTSEGYVPDPLSYAACWYRQAVTGSVGQGNFLKEPADNGDDTWGGLPMDGGTSAAPHAGAIVSPVIDLGGESGPLALTFRTWWEIEAVNPNENGFDLMSIEYREEDGLSWNTLARLNPLSDPSGFEDNAALPYSSRGFNKAPSWVSQEPIPLDSLAGKRFQLRFAFYTEDELYNGFRGWLVDDVRIVRQQGTFPLWDADIEASGDLTVTDISPVPFGYAGVMEKLVAGVEQTFSLHAHYTGDEKAVRVVLFHYTDIISEPVEVDQLPVGELSGPLSAILTPGSSGSLLLSVAVIDSSGDTVEEKPLYYISEN